MNSLTRWQRAGTDAEPDRRSTRNAWVGSESHEYVPRGDPADITPTIVASFPFSDETVSLVADRIVNTYGGNTSDYESTLAITDTTDFAGKVVTARGRTPHSTQRIANYGAQALSELIVRGPAVTAGQRLILPDQ